MRYPSCLIAPLAVLAFSAMGVSGQAETPIYMEEIKLGHEVAYERTSSGWPKMFEEAGSPDIYLAMQSISGPPMVWYVQPFENYAAEGRAMKAVEDNPALSAQLEGLWKEHGRPDLSGGDFPDLNLARFLNITIFRVKPGYDAQFEEAARTYAEVSSRLAPETSYRTYQVMTGMPGGAYFIFGSVDDYGGFDAVMARDMTVWEGMSDDEREVFDTFAREGMQSVITYRFRLSPTMSFVNAEMKAADPAFWSR
jgi:hypothetical protein